MKIIKIVALWTGVLLFAACKNINHTRGDSQDKFVADTTTIAKQKPDTFKTDTPSSTNGPDNAPPADSTMKK
ncbi:MAG TPA: hypothetical protein VN721_09740 [Flavipsychrobacter sp.]|nr:hypothetical protein [Flavipsychrobacter sp.]